MDHLLDVLRTHFDPLQNRMESFARHGVQTEGWFKGELLVALDSLVRNGQVKSFDREVRHTVAQTLLVAAARNDEAAVKAIMKAAQTKA